MVLLKTIAHIEKRMPAAYPQPLKRAVKRRMIIRINLSAYPSSKLA